MDLWPDCRVFVSQNVSWHDGLNNCKNLISRLSTKEAGSIQMQMLCAGCHVSIAAETAITPLCLLPRSPSLPWRYLRLLVCSAFERSSWLTPPWAWSSEERKQIRSQVKMESVGADPIADSYRSEISWWYVMKYSVINLKPQMGGG